MHKKRPFKFSICFQDRKFFQFGARLGLEEEENRNENQTQTLRYPRKFEGKISIYAFTTLRKIFLFFYNLLFFFFLVLLPVLPFLFPELNKQLQISLNATNSILIVIQIFQK